MSDDAPVVPDDNNQSTARDVTCGVQRQRKGSHVTARFQKATHLMPGTTVLIFSQNFFRSARTLMGGDSLFMPTKQDSTPPENAELFAKKIGSASLYTHCTHLIGHHPIAFFSDISNIFCR
jgi:hypothetical protein